MAQKLGLMVISGRCLPPFKPLAQALTYLKPKTHTGEQGYSGCIYYTHCWEMLTLDLEFSGRPSEPISNSLFCPQIPLNIHSEMAKTG